MHLASRDLKPADLCDAVALIRNQPRERERYGPLLDQLEAVWSVLLRRDALKAITVDDLDQPGKQLRALLVRAFVTDEFVRECKRLTFSLGPELVRRVSDGCSPIIGAKGVAAANAGDGLNSALWVCCTDSPSDDDPKLVDRVFMEAFGREHRGFQIKEMLIGDLDVTNAKVALFAGASFWNPQTRQYATRWHGSDDEIARLVERPCLIGTTRDLAFQGWGSWVSGLFAWSPPRMAFSAAEQRLMLAAGNGQTDEELAIELALSLWTVKNTWRSIFARVDRSLPRLMPETEKRKPGTELRRGKEKRTRLLAYVRDHPEELRPYAVKARGGSLLAAPGLAPRAKGKAPVALAKTP